MSSSFYTWTFLIVAQVLVWLQLNGQFIWPWFRSNPNLVSLIFAWPVSWLFVYYQKYAYETFDQSIWSARLFGYGIGMIIFLIMTGWLKGEVISIKNAICLALSMAIILVQIIMK